MKRFVIALALNEQETAVKALYVGDDGEKAIAAVDKELTGKSKFVRGICFRHVGKGIFYKRNEVPDKPRPEVLTPQQREALREVEEKALARVAAAETLKDVSDEELEAYGLQRVESEGTGPDGDPDSASGAGDPPSGESGPGTDDPGEDDDGDPSTGQSDVLPD